MYYAKRKLFYKEKNKDIKEKQEIKMREGKQSILHNIDTHTYIQKKPPFYTFLITKDFTGQQGLAGALEGKNSSQTLLNASPVAGLLRHSRLLMCTVRPL